MRKLNWLFTCAALATIFLAGCNNTTEPATNASTEPTKTDTASTEPDKKVEAQTTAPVETTEAVKTGDAEAKKPSEKEAAAKGEAGVQKTDQAKADSAKESQQKVETARVAGQKVNPDGTIQLDAKPQDERTSTGTKNASAKPVPQKDPTPADVNKAATTSQYTGTWKRYIDPKLRAKYDKVAQVQKKRGKKIFPIDNILTMKGDGTFVWDDNALITGRKVTGTWSVKNGMAMFVVKAVDGKAPTKDEAKAFEASVAKSGKMLYRGNTARGRYDKV